ncbi:MAG TPA: DUF1538 domain-containing protein [Fastidiosipila sp.]|nr:DUF1538 domain-containing protein [Fastidiosipila sp.]
MGALNEKLKEVTMAVLPVTVLVLILHFTALTPLTNAELIRFLIGAAFLIFGLALFLLGVDLGATPIGKASGYILVRTNKLGIVLAGGFILGLLITVAEPDLAILADQIALITRGVLGRWQVIIFVSVGVGLLVMFAFLRIIKRLSLRLIIYISYGIILLLSIFVPQAFHAFAFDASGATTGAITVPFMLALAIGTSRYRAHQEKDAAASFGMVGLASAGAIIGLLVKGVLSSFADFSAEHIVETVVGDQILPFFWREFLHSAYEGALSLMPLAVVLLIIQVTKSRLRMRAVIRVAIGLAYCMFGLVIFMTGVKAGFMPAGQKVGGMLAGMGYDWLLIVAGFFIGMLTILAEPAVHVLTKQIELETAGNVPRRLVLIFLSAGVSISIVLSMLRIMIPGLKLWHILLPCYVIIMILTHFTPELFIGIAYDSGGVASGPMTATFILAFAKGAASQTDGADVILDGFGVIALVAMTPLIALQLLGLLHKVRMRRLEKKQLARLAAADSEKETT